MNKDKMKKKRLGLQLGLLTALMVMVFGISMIGEAAETYDENISVNYLPSSKFRSSGFDGFM